MARLLRLRQESFDSHSVAFTRKKIENEPILQF
eukprot:CAMPEP_0175163550 /NCGR_PEP_ID=MMETSP0087-20121206/25839_1 /TAXON_ID=136419 /ORGANISM="Unknown Unknown, Strain D1" /LENGTH=32 /DNA_ID= /DNA_START= /DNA_END= /DNA_ORIENTATION=